MALNGIYKASYYQECLAYEVDYFKESHTMKFNFLKTT
jgi:hypothetical protein